ncbi:MAG: hypothetical protein IEMM0008_1106 [bacterium]|nr:MAG: hypothetical protein IEMM0008_1106 [bacterium]
MSVHNETDKEKALKSLVSKRKEHPGDGAFFDSLDKVERVLLTDIHFGIFYVNEDLRKLLEMKGE